MPLPLCIASYYFEVGNNFSLRSVVAVSHLQFVRNLTIYDRTQFDGGTINRRFVEVYLHGNLRESEH